MGRWIAALSAGLLLFTFGFDLLTPQNLVLAILYNIPIALSTLVLSRQLTLAVAVAALLANVLAGFYNAGHEQSFDSIALGNRVLAALSFFLVAVLSLRAAQASAQASEARAREEKANLERLIRRIIEELSGSLLPKELLERTCKLLQTVLEAKGVGVLEGAEVPQLLVHFPADWQPIVPPSQLPNGVTRGLEQWVAALKPQQWLVIHEPRFSQAKAVLTEILPTLQALLGKAELFERTQLQQGEITRRSGVIRDLVYAFSHDLRTPLMANALNMRLALEGAYGDLPEDYRRSLQHGLESNQELLEMADSLLLLARLESDETESPALHLDLARIARESIERIQALYDQKRVGLSYVGPEHLELQGKETQLRRLLQNLLDNALKFSPSMGKVQVQLEAREGQAMLRVVDEGKGVSKGLQPKLFGRFAGSHESSRGLGLYLCQQIVLAHRGSIVYRDNPGGGSIFEVRLPL